MTLLQTPTSTAGSTARSTTGLKQGARQYRPSAEQRADAARHDRRQAQGNRRPAERGGTDRSLQYQKTLSRLQDVDLNEAISSLTRQQLNLEAAQKSYVQVSGLSLLNYL